MALPLPKNGEELTLEWLNGVLAPTELGAAGAIASFEREVIGEGAGFIGELNRLSLQFERPAPGRPETLIAKLPTNDEMIRGLATLFGFYEREINFYQDVADEIETRTPKCYFSAMDKDAGAYVLLLEDLAPMRCGDQLASCSLDEARLALSEIAKLHAGWWDSPRLAELDWLPGLDDPEMRQLLLAVYQQSWPTFASTFKDELPKELIDIGERFGQQFDRLVDVLAQRPRTIAHTDFRLDNMFFGGAGGSGFALIDWQLVQRGPGTIDVAYFLAGNFPPEVRREHQEALLKHYHQALTTHGVAGYSYDQLWEDYRRSMLFLLLFIVPNREFFDMDKYNQRARDLVQALVERYSTAILGVDAVEFLQD